MCHQPLPHIRFGKQGMMPPALELGHGLKVTVALVNQAQH